VSLRLRIAELYVPKWVARSAVRRLFGATGAAFGRDPVALNGLDHRALLERYASFTATSAEAALADQEDLDALSRRLWDAANVLGRSVRRGFGVRTREDALRAARVVYRMIGIDLRADPHGDVVVDRCSFAAWYSPQVCGAMSSLDAGMIAGLTGGGRLTFTERITEGSPQCLARISWHGVAS
jgi:hypothetical protein